MVKTYLPILNQRLAAATLGVQAAGAFDTTQLDRIEEISQIRYRAFLS